MSKKNIITIVILVVMLGVIVGGLAWTWFILQDHPLFSILRAPEEPIEEVIIRGYGNIPPFLLEGAKSAIEEKIGVRAYIDSLYPSFSGQSFYYNSERDQYDADRIWDTEGRFASSVSNKRLIMIIDVDVYTEIQPERPYVLSRSTPNVSVILISAYRLQRLSDTKIDESAPVELATARVQKLVLQTLGVSVFLEGFFAYGRTQDISCVMYRGRVLSELDRQGNDFCEKNKRKLKDYFVMNAAE